MATVNSSRQAWATRTLFDELRRESREIMWQRLAQARPLAGIPLPRPCDPRPGHFIDQMLAKAHTQWRETVEQAVGYDSRFLLPEGDRILALPAPAVKPVEAVAKTRVIKLQAPAPMPVQAAAILLLPSLVRETEIITLGAVRLGRYGMMKAA